MTRAPLISDPDVVEADERTPLVNGTHAQTKTDDADAAIANGQSDVVPTSRATIVGILSTLMLGVFIASADSSIVIATSSQIASEFNRFSEASWLVTSYSLAQCACQPLYGKLSDIFGRRSVLVFSYIVFLVGCGLCGIGQTYWQVIAGRAISGIGGAGMSGLVSVIIADMLPIREVAKWRSYVNVVSTVGRSCGGPLGGWLVDTTGWRWIFLGQCPISAVSILLVAWRLPNLTTPLDSQDQEQRKETFKGRLRRIDFLGAALLPSALIAFFIALDFVGKSYRWFYIAPLAGLSLILTALFLYVENYKAVEPVFPLSIVFKRDVFTANALAGLQLAAQFTIFYTTPIYFQVITGISAAAAGSRLILMVVGNMVGGIVAGHLISRTRHYKVITTIAVGLGSTCYLLVLIRWRGSTAWYDTAIVILGGFGMGMTQSSSFIHLAASLTGKEIAIASMSWYLSANIGMLVAANLFNALHNTSLLAFLKQDLREIDNADKIIHGAVSDLEFIRTLPEGIQKLVIHSYVNSLSVTNAMSLAFGLCSVVAALTVREHPLAE
ncbi:unnamed protein product [Clonostachys rosea]|uniref:Major facilitator superfamily (MFS) profile domain-containing protein n=1 Tax=Bionectria ochroleuca TaxID=29856 RepID=A0ABY6TZU8_BIOOC|nr:unnamed protein product [Clonostachys rosea]